MVRPTSGAIRAANRAAVVRVLRQTGWATRAEIVRRTRLSRATVSSVIGELETRRLISERRGDVGRDHGRPAALVGLNRSAGIAIAVDVGVHHLAVAVGDLSRSVLAEHWTDLPGGHGAARGTEIVLAGIDRSLHDAAVDPDQLVGAAISIAAPVANDSGRLLVPGVLPGWNGSGNASALADAVAERWCIPVAIDNDANLGALGEAVTRPGDEGLLYVKAASRIGLGIVSGGRVVRGRHGYAGELGHVTVDAAGGRCWCGRRGCLELYAGADGMLRRMGADAGGSVAELLQRIRADGSARVVVEQGMVTLAAAIANAAMLLDPDRIVIGGELSALGTELLIEPVRRQLASIPFASEIPVAPSALGERASLLGALALVLDESTHFVDRSQGPRPSAAPRCSLTVTSPHTIRTEGVLR